jgi:hypothetical protein
VNDEAAPLDVDKASAASTKLRLSNIVLLAIEARTLAPYLGAGNLSYDVDHLPAVWNLLEDALVSVYGVTVKIRNRAEADTIDLCSISVRARAEYDFKQDFSRDTDEALLNDYIGIVGRLHVWPYFRSEVQQLTSKLGLPALTLPVLLSGHMATLPSKRATRKPMSEKPAPLPKARKATQQRRKK